VTDDFCGFQWSIAWCFIVAPYPIRVSENMVSAVGSTVRLDCQFHGVPAPVLSWAKDSYALWSSARLRVHQGTVLISETVADDSGLYQCWAESDAGIEYVVIRLLVQPLLTTFSSIVPPSSQYLHVTCNKYRCFFISVNCLFYKLSLSLILFSWIAFISAIDMVEIAKLESCACVIGKLGS